MNKVYGQRPDGSLLLNDGKPEIENMRRMAERGLKRAQLEKKSAYVDMFQHILDCYNRI